jgi:GNAT superfamily N-acetyltransferase
VSATSTVTVREATAADVTELSVLLAQLGYSTPPPSVAERLSSLSTGGLTRILVADAGAGAIGFLALTRMDILPYPEPLARITALCVEESSRSAGVGKALEERAAEVARGWGCGKIEVTSSRRRLRAHAFYERHGYEETHRCFVKRLPAANQGGQEHAPR